MQNTNNCAEFAGGRGDARPRIFVFACAVLAVLASGCIGPMASGSFDRSLTVSGPVQIELRGGSGRVELRAGASGQVRVHGDFQVNSMGFESAKHEADDLVAHPPVEQNGALVRIGSDVERFMNASVNYTIEVPPQTEARIDVGSGSVDVAGVDGPIEVSAGSGHVSVRNVKQDVRVGTGSGTVDLQDLSGRVNAIVRSGGLSISDVAGDVTAEASSGHINVMHARGKVEVHGGSGGVDVTGATQDLRATGSSGHVTVSGTPARGSYWDIRAGSGRVTLDIAETGYELYAHASSGSIHTSGGQMIVEESARRSLRAKVGDGAARVEVETRSGTIDVR